MAAIVAGDLLFKFSVAAAAGNTTSGTAAGSLGDQVSTTQVPDNTLHALFDAISGAENAASTVDYRGIFLHNNNGANNYVSPGIYLSAEVAGGASIAMAADTVATSAVGSGSTQMTTIANETTAPGGQSFSAPTTSGSAISLSDVPFGNVKGIWYRRTAANSAALSADGFTMTLFGDTGSA